MLEARTIGRDARLDWKVACFLEYARFEIQRSANGVNYTTINVQEAGRARCRQPFYFTDVNVPGKAFYRIRVGDLDGRVYHSKVAAVTGKERGFEINTLTPSLITGSAILSISSATKDNAEILVTNFQGTRVKQFKAILNKGITELPIELSNIAKGNYLLTISNGISEAKTTRFTKL